MSTYSSIYHPRRKRIYFCCSNCQQNRFTLSYQYM